MLTSMDKTRRSLTTAAVLAVMVCLFVGPLKAQTMCDSNCLTCGAFSCTSCKTGYYSSGFNCMQCGSNCKECSSSLFCLSCNEGYTSSFFGNNCESCGTGCKSCLSTASCSTCKSGYYQTLGSVGSCSACPSGCSSCTSPYLSSSFMISSSSSTAKCTACNLGYSLDDDKCVKKNATGGIVGGVIGAVAFILIIAAIIYCCRRKPVVTQSTTVTSFNPNANSTTIMYNNGQPSNGMQINFHQQPQTMGGPTPGTFGQPPAGPTPNVWGPQPGPQPSAQFGGPAPYYPGPPGFTGAAPIQPVMGQPPMNGPAGNGLPPGFLDNKPAAKAF